MNRTAGYVSTDELLPQTGTRKNCCAKTRTACTGAGPKRAPVPVGCTGTPFSFSLWIPYTRKLNVSWGPVHIFTLTMQGLYFRPAPSRSRVSAKKRHSRFKGGEKKRIYDGLREKPGFCTPGATTLMAFRVTGTGARSGCVRFRALHQIQTTKGQLPSRKMQSTRCNQERQEQHMASFYGAYQHYGDLTRKPGNGFTR